MKFRGRKKCRVEIDWMLRSRRVNNSLNSRFQSISVYMLDGAQKTRTTDRAAGSSENMQSTRLPRRASSPRNGFIASQWRQFKRGTASRHQPEHLARSCYKTLERDAAAMGRVLSYRSIKYVVVNASRGSENHPPSQSSSPS
jgi:hypothetical protein